MTDLLTPQPTRRNAGEPDSLAARLVGRISKLEIAVGAAIAAVLLVLVILEPDILEAPFENANTMLFTVGGTVLAAGALVAMLWFRVPPPVRVVVLVVPFAIVNWWLLSPYFIDDVVDEEFSTSISAQAGLGADTAQSPGATAVDDATTDEAGPSSDDATSGAGERAGDTGDGDDSDTSRGAPDEASGSEAAAGRDASDTETAGADATASEQTASEAVEPAAVEPPAPTGPVLLGAGQFVGLAGHFGTGDAGVFENPDGSLVLRFENFDIQNGPDLEVYLVPGADQTSLAAGSIHLGALKGNIGDQNYELPAGIELAPGAYTALVWCEAFSVEFVGATISV